MGFSHAYGAPTERSEAVRAIRAAYDMGYTLFDTAETYGTAADPHENEKLVGEALKDVRDKVQIVTKFGIRFDETSTAVNKPLIPDARPETIRSSVEGSLRRLQTDPHRPLLSAPNGPQRGAGGSGPGDGRPDPGG